MCESYAIVLDFTKCKGVVSNSERYTAYNNDCCFQTWLQKVFKGGEYYIGAVKIAILTNSNFVHPWWDDKQSKPTSIYGYSAGPFSV